MSYRVDWRELNEYVSKRALWLNIFNELIPGALGDALAKFSPSNHANAKTFCPSPDHGAATNQRSTGHLPDSTLVCLRERSTLVG